MNIIIAGDLFSFPNGVGATARVHAYGRGFVDNGAQVKVLCLEPNEPRTGPRLNPQTRGECGGIRFEYPYGATARPASFLARRWLQFTNPFRFLKVVWTEARERGADAIIVYSRSVFWILVAAVACWLVGAKCIHEDVEFPFIDFEGQKKTVWLRLYIWFYAHLLYKLFDGLIVITRYLGDYCAQYVRPGVPVLNVPTLVDVTPFESVPAIPSDGQRRIVYCGTLARGDEVSNMIHTLAALADYYPDCHLQILGDYKGRDVVSVYKQLATDLCVGDRVEFTGMVKRSDLPRYLCAAEVLALPRAAGVFSQAGFPVKLGEYLATGKPVLVTSTGDIPLYLEDGVSAYLVPPDDASAFIERLRHILSHPQEAAEVGLRGREVARQKLNYRVHCRRILQMIRELQRGQAFGNADMPIR